MLLRIKELLIKEFLQMLRDPRMRVFIFVAPAFQMLVIAFALTTDVEHIRTAIVDRDGSVISRQLIEAFSGSSHFEPLYFLSDDDRIDQLLDEGKVRAVIQIPAGFEASLLNGRSVVIQINTDGTDSNTSSIVNGYATGIMGRFVQEFREDHPSLFMGSGSALPGRVSLAVRAWNNVNMESSLYYIPGLIAVMVTVVSLLLTCLAVVREKEIGTIEQLMVTPIRRAEFILGKTIPYLIFGLIILTILLFLAFLVFDIQIKGNIFLLYICAAIFIVGNLGAALLISVTARTQQQALLTAFFIMMPFVLLSGYMFPIHNMPVEIQWFTWANPMRWFIQIIRGVVIKGVGVDALLQPIIMQTVLATIFLFFAGLRFHKTIS